MKRKKKMMMMMKKKRRRKRRKKRMMKKNMETVCSAPRSKLGVRNDELPAIQAGGDDVALT